MEPEAGQAAVNVALATLQEAVSFLQIDTRALIEASAGPWRAHQERLDALPGSS